MKRILLLCLLLTSCTTKQIEKPLPEKSEVTLPPSQTTKMSDSFVTTNNIDDYLFLDDVIYIDLRDAVQFMNEGSIAGFINIPFYQMIASVKYNPSCLYTMTKKAPIQLGDVGSYQANYKESDENIFYLIPDDKKIIFISTAGVEATYMINLLIQLGYDSTKLYNAGGFSNTVGNNIAYKDIKTTKYKVAPLESNQLTITYSWNKLTPNN